MIKFGILCSILRRSLTFDQYSGWGSTFRYPAQDGSGNIISQDDSVTAALDQQVQSIQQNVYLIMGSYTDFAAFSNTTWDTSGQPGAYGSLEDIHDNIHGTVGGSTPTGAGDMSILDYAAFDPVFWLHHCMLVIPFIALH